MRMLVIGRKAEVGEVATYKEEIISEAVGNLLLGKACKLVMDFKLMRTIVTNLKLQALILYSVCPEIENADKLIEGLDLDCLFLEGPHENTRLSLSSVKKMCAKKIPSRLVCKLYESTLSEVADFFEIFQEKWKKSLISWCLETDKGTMTADEILPYLKRLKCFKGYDIITKHNERLIFHFDILVRSKLVITLRVRL